MKWIGLTGSIGTGKSTVTGILRTLGYAVVDADELARQTTQAGAPALNEIARAFGPDVIGTDGRLDRKKLGQIIFQDEGRRLKLESILHPQIRQLADDARKKLEAEGRDLAFYDVPLLFEKKMESLFDEIVVVACKPELQLQRILSRGNISESEARDRMAAQLPMAHKVKGTSFVIQNNGSLEELKQQVQQTIRKLQASLSKSP